MARTMAWRAAVAAAMLLAGGCGGPAPRTAEPAAPSPWRTVARGALAAVEAQRALYTHPDYAYPFVRLRIVNLGGETIGADLGDRAIHPNAWTGGDLDWRPEIGERRIAPRTPVGDTARELALALERGELVTIPPGGAADAYVVLPETREAIEAAGGRYFIVSLDGQILVTDGRRSESLDTLWRPGYGPEESDLVLPRPIEFRPAPPDARIVE